MRLLIGIDDTDNLESRGTGFRARQLGQHLTASVSDVQVRGISRHQLLVDDRIPYTSHNSAACLDVEAVGDQSEAVVTLAREFLARESAAGSDAGLCVASLDQVTDEVLSFARQAKTEVIETAGAHDVAARSGLRLEGVTGERIGVIGALAAVGLRAACDDGRVLWLEGLRELTGDWRVADLKEALPGVVVEDIAGRVVDAEERVELGDWVRPILREGRMVLLVCRIRENRENGGTHGDAHVDWVVADRDRIKQLSQ